jgi:hypothetical protein
MTSVWTIPVRFFTCEEFKERLDDTQLLPSTTGLRHNGES